jgi:adenosine deaminase
MFFLPPAPRGDPVGADLIASLPKAELHVHLPGCVRASTLAELSARHGVALPLPAGELYARVNSVPAPEEAHGGPWFPLLRIYELICRCLRTADDFARVAYEAMHDAFVSSNVVHQELSFSPSVHLAQGVKYAEMAIGLAEGLRAAREDFNVSGLVIAAINREDTAATALAMVDALVEHPTHEVVAIGLDFDERKGAPEVFADAYRLAGRHGLHRTAHAGEHVAGPAGAANVRKCVELLGCERVDHGYYVLEDTAVVDWARKRGLHFNIAFTTSRRALRPWRRARVAEMLKQGLEVNLSSDDPALFPTTVANEFAIARDELGLGVQELVRLAKNSARASFLEPKDKAALLHRIEVSASVWQPPMP